MNIENLLDQRELLYTDKYIKLSENFEIYCDIDKTYFLNNKIKVYNVYLFDVVTGESLKSKVFLFKYQAYKYFNKLTTMEV